ncbi:MAG: DUF58 domain-containing protein [Gaiellaceae bacterium]
MALGLLAGLVLGRPELVALAAPFALLLGAGVVLGGEPQVRLAFLLDQTAALEEEELDVTILVTSDAPVELALVLPYGIEVAEGERAVALTSGQHEVELKLRCARWGGYVLGETVVRARGLAGLYSYERRDHAALPLKVFAKPEPLRDLLSPLETQAATGNHVARVAAEGIEFADLRQFAPGDRPRRINWRASARRGELWVNQSHPERASDVVIFLDTFTEARGAAEGTLEYAVRATAALAGQYLQHRDRVGLVGFGGLLNWLVPASGPVQRLRIVDALLDTEIVLNYAWKDVEIIPRRTLPPQALVLALTPLLDERAVAALLDLRARRFDLAVIELSPVPYLAHGPERTDPAAFRLWLLGREALRARFRAAGVPIVEWSEGTPLAPALEEVRLWRRRARVARA